MSEHFAIVIQEKTIKRTVAWTVALPTKAQRRWLQALSRRDERFATLGVLNLVTTAEGRRQVPAHYWIWHLLRFSFYISTSYARFRQQKWELYLRDWCYVVTFLSTRSCISSLFGREREMQWQRQDSYKQCLLLRTSWIHTTFTKTTCSVHWWTGTLLRASKFCAAHPQVPF